MDELEAKPKAQVHFATASRQQREGNFKSELETGKGTDGDCTSSLHFVHFAG